jgi:hypothetical protein
MAGERMPPRNFARPGLLETFGRTLVRLHLGHDFVLEILLIGGNRPKNRTTPSPRSGSGTTLESITCEDFPSGSAFRCFGSWIDD